MRSRSSFAVTRGYVRVQSYFIVFRGESGLIGAGAQVAARQAAFLFALAGVAALVGSVVSPAGRPRDLLLVAATDVVVAVAAWWLPWRRWGPLAPLALGPPAFAVLAAATWAFGGVAAGTGPFLVLIYTWLGLNFPPWASAAATPAALLAYTAPLVITGQPPEVIGGAFVLLPVALGVALLIAHQVRHQLAARERIARIERWRAALTSTLAHDVRTPLATVQLVLESVRSDGDDMPPDRRDQMLAAALRQLGRIGRMSAGLLDAERVTAQGELRLDLSEVPVRQAADDALEQLNRSDIAVDVPPDLIVRADPERFQQMLINLVSNALRHGTPPVEIRARAVGDRARIEVRDHGPGVPPHEREHLFTAFRGRSDMAGSIGLGLWIVDQLVGAHGGDIHYEPADPGARLVFTLPLWQSPAAGPRTTGDPRAHGSGQAAAAGRAPVRGALRRRR